MTMPTLKERVELFAYTYCPDNFSPTDMTNSTNELLTAIFDEIEKRQDDQHITALEQIRAELGLERKK